MKSGLFSLILLVCLFGLSGYGYICNLIALVNLSPFVFDAKSIIGIGGIFVPPVGIIMGIFVW